VERARQRRGTLAVRAAVPSDRGNYGIARPGAIHGARAVDAGGFRGLRLLVKEKRRTLRFRRGGGSEEDQLREIGRHSFPLDSVSVSRDSPALKTTLQGRAALRSGETTMDSQNLRGSVTAKTSTRCLDERVTNPDPELCDQRGFMFKRSFRIGTIAPTPTSRRSRPGSSRRWSTRRRFPRVAVRTGSDAGWTEAGGLSAVTITVRHASPRTDRHPRRG
jgi:hypothetical protein